MGVEKFVALLEEKLGRKFDRCRARSRGGLRSIAPRTSASTRRSSRG
jgi:hypothetical protein